MRRWSGNSVKWWRGRSRRHAWRIDVARTGAAPALSSGPELLEQLDKPDAAVFDHVQRPFERSVVPAVGIRDFLAMVFVAVVQEQLDLLLASRRRHRLQCHHVRPIHREDHVEVVEIGTRYL